VDRWDIEQITRAESAPLREAPPQWEESILRRPRTEDETDRLGRMLVQRMMEAGVVEPL